MENPVIDWRIAVLVAVAVVAAYLGVALSRLLQLRGTRPPAPGAAARSAPAPASDALWKAEMEDELRRVAGELAALRDELTQLRAMKSVAPQYGDAVALAQQGLAAADIAERCGISVGEAELILALARKPPD